MNINATLIVQMITFAFFVWFTMRFVWPPITKALEERQNKIAAGLAAAERGQREFELAQARAKEDLKHARVLATEIVEKAHHKAAEVIEAAAVQATDEGLRLIAHAKGEIEQEVHRVKAELSTEVASMTRYCCEKILEQKMDGALNDALIKKLILEM